MPPPLQKPVPPPEAAPPQSAGPQWGAVPLGPVRPGPPAALPPATLPPVPTGVVPPAAVPPAAVPPAAPWAAPPPPSPAPPVPAPPARPALPATPENLRRQVGLVPGDATRYLCAAAWLDRHFRGALIRELVEHSVRIPAPSPGTDVVRVLHEALTARRWEAWTGAVLLIVLVLGFPLFGVAAGSVAVLVALLPVLFLGAGADRMDHRLGLEVEETEFPAPRPRSRVVRTEGLVLGCLLAVALVGVLAHELPSYDADWAGLLGPVFAELLMLCLVAAALRYGIRRRLVALGGLGPAPVPPVEPQGGVAARLYERLREQQGGPELLYSRQAPLVGLGVPGRAWRMTFELRPSAERDTEGRAPDPLDAAVLYRAIAQQVRALAQDPRYPEDPLRGLSVTDRVYRPGLRDDHPADWLGAMSVRAGDRFQLEPAWADLLSRTGHERLRHYLAVRVGSWQEEVVVTVLVRASTRGGLLYLEWLPYVLGPVAHHYHVVDLLGERSDLGHAVNALGWAARRLSSDVGAAVRQLWEVQASNSRGARHRQHYAASVRAGRAVDYAPRTSARELGSAGVYENLFQEHDVQRFLNTVTQRVFSAVGGELRARGYDNAAFEEQSQSITNINNGGVQVVNSAVDGPVVGGAGANINLPKGKNT
ncbi:hypothetical protein [Kitasatospora sp. NPDC015120]|uniref:hypothetical protein n=1 Tax=Kitasatospora sp. NPDC015120 TaxID=3364023 RepID=UPI0036F46C02